MPAVLGLIVASTEACTSSRREACFQETKNDGLWCLGDNGYGQLGGSRPVPPFDAGPDDPAFVARAWPAQSVALGMWHACALASSNNVAGGGYSSCWGR